MKKIMRPGPITVTSVVSAPSVFKKTAYISLLRQSISPPAAKQRPRFPSRNVKDFDAYCAIRYHILKEIR